MTDPRSALTKNQWEQNADLFDDLLSHVPNVVSAAEEKLIRNNQGLVYRMVNRFREFLLRKYDVALDEDDLFQVGRIGLLIAVRKFEPERGYQLSTYAIWWINQAIQREIQYGGMIRIPVQMRREIARYSAIEYALIDETVGNHDELIRAHMQLDEEEFAHVRHAARVLRGKKISTHDVFMKGKGWQTTVGELLHASPSEPSEISLGVRDFGDIYEDKEFQAMCVRLVNYFFAQDVLTDRQREVLVRRFSLDGNPSETLKQIGLRLHLSRERVRQIEESALQLLRDPDVWNKHAEFIHETFSPHPPARVFLIPCAPPVLETFKHGIRSLPHV